MSIADLIKAEIDNIPEDKLEELYQYIKKLAKPQKTLNHLWQKIDELGEDEDQLSMEEITSLVKEVREKKSKYGKIKVPFNIPIQLLIIELSCKVMIFTIRYCWVTLHLTQPTLATFL